MKFIGGTHHGRDVPIALQVAIYSERRDWVQVAASGHAAPGPHACGARAAPDAVTERYRVVSWRTVDGSHTKLLAREGMSREAIALCAATLPGLAAGLQ